jgi:hypothetical protein
METDHAGIAAQLNKIADALDDEAKRIEQAPAVRISEKRSAIEVIKPHLDALREIAGEDEE